MRKSSLNNNNDFPNGWDEHWRQQVIFIAENTTALQRIEWIENMLELFKDQIPKRDTVPEYWTKGPSRNNIYK